MSASGVSGRPQQLQNTQGIPKAQHPGLLMSPLDQIAKVVLDSSKSKFASDFEGDESPESLRKRISMPRSNLIQLKSSCGGGPVL
ncbi:uncharacterized protein EKO05_0006918 [Ascochyta rabiei]|uniref:uncharacterized protein n=1 Tax=Didymella rabiei TaxID=5454 RepID=UPI00220F9197|nr:uncharacterized protein EKO05_0006918 [Ascochyta rabiei]UPX16521.1 hypothetical protein EKO05_0006918 [Ascochyta rabiei]